MLEETLKIANSIGLWVCALVTVLLVFIQSFLYVRMSVKEAKARNMDKSLLTKSFRIGATTAFGPAVSGLVVMVGLIAAIGLPISWMRLSIIGATATELTAATVAAQTIGLELGHPQYTLEALSLGFFTMAINVTGWLLVCTFFTHKMEDMRLKMGKGDTKWLNLITAGASVGVFGNLAAQRCVAGMAPLVACVGSILSMYIMQKYLCPRVKGLSEWALGICMIISMVLGTLTASAIS